MGEATTHLRISAGGTGAFSPGQPGNENSKASTAAFHGIHFMGTHLRRSPFI